ncbi:hypothetical protein NDN08_000213 [Rhodosorus marinus]|uniref:G10 protein n=1 Tax=Rhodosorus marinus TaxID=101924 RepID=A0AAV8UEN0_9RHOD|nr:hypothetical protein NDN08_000213 [Rhodosorus marinus]
MSWRLAMKRKRPPAGWEIVEPKLEEFEEKMRDAMNEPVEDKMRNEITWVVHKIHYQKNRYMFNLYHEEHQISKKLYDYLIDMKIADGPLLAKWRKAGYETLCSVAVIAKSNTNFRTTGICRVPLRERHGQITPNVTTGCVSCASGDGGPIWWDDPVPEVVTKRRRQVLVEEEELSSLPTQSKEDEDGGGEGEVEEPVEGEENGREEAAQPSDVDRQTVQTVDESEKQDKPEEGRPENAPEPTEDVETKE